MKNSKLLRDSKLLRLLLKSGKERIKFLRESNLILKPISKKILPAKTYLRSWYNQAYLSFYMGAPDAALSLIYLILERITRNAYRDVIPNPKSESKIDWEIVLKDLETHFLKFKGKKKELDSIKQVRLMKKERNKHQHADVDWFLKNYSSKTWKLHTENQELKLTEVPSNSKIIPSELKVRTKQLITVRIVLRLLVHLNFVIINLRKYIT